MYRETADLYDKLTKDVDYPAYAGFLMDIIGKHSQNAHSLVEIGCGTGNLTRVLASAGFDMTGVDSSNEMLAEAYSKENAGILWINQDVTELDLFGSYDAAISFLDFPNHITDYNDLSVYFKRLYNFVNQGGLCIFDVNSEYKFREILGSNVFYYDEEDYSLIWQNHYDEDEKTCTMDITVFRREGEVFNRIDTVNIERYYSGEQLDKVLVSAGFSHMATYGDLSLEAPESDIERIFYVYRKEANDG